MSNQKKKLCSISNPFWHHKELISRTLCTECHLLTIEPHYNFLHNMEPLNSWLLVFWIHSFDQNKLIPYHKTRIWTLFQRRRGRGGTSRWLSSSRRAWTHTDPPGRFKETETLRKQTLSGGWSLKKNVFANQRHAATARTCVMLEKPMMKEMKQTMRMKTFLYFLSCMGYSSMRAVMKPSTVQNCDIAQSRGELRLLCRYWFHIMPSDVYKSKSLQNKWALFSNCVVFF